MGHRMKARYVYESLNFERGRDPKDAMGIGIKYRHDSARGLGNPHYSFIRTIVDNLDLFTNGKYNTFDVVPYADHNEGFYGLPHDLIDMVKKNYLDDPRTFVSGQYGRIPSDSLIWPEIRKGLYLKVKNGKKLRSPFNAYRWPDEPQP
jgi:hypothetical protein